MTAAFASRVAGNVYILVSPNCEYVKIGGSDFAPRRRVAEINGSEPYKRLGPWSLHDFRQVTDWRRVEYALHYAFRSKRVTSIAAQRELFAVSRQRASAQLDKSSAPHACRKPQVDRLFQDEDFAAYLTRLFRASAIVNWLDLQGAWTLRLFPSTGGGRYFTLNIGRHEVAFATNPPNGGPPLQMIHMDRLIRDFEEVVQWVADRDGRLVDDRYASGLQRSTSVQFEGHFPVAKEFLALNGVRRAVIAYWNEALIQLQERRVGSVFGRFHDMNAVSELKRRIESGAL